MGDLICRGNSAIGTHVNRRNGGEVEGKTVMLITLKAVLYESFDFRFFMNQFLRASEYTVGAISNFYENSQKYLEVKVNHRCQRHRR